MKDYLWVVIEDMVKKGMIPNDPFAYNLVALILTISIGLIFGMVFEKLV